jgi:pimeloyl-ACP methyl ester carboxylesterase
VTQLVSLPTSQISVLQLPQAGVETHAEDVVMIHGLGANLGFWYAGAAQLFTHFGRVTLYDMLGHGHSDMPESGYSPRQMADDLGLLLDRLNIERVHLVAHSYGGMVALSFALQQPERVKSLVLADVRVWQVEPPSWKTVQPAWLQRMRDAGLPLEESAMDPSFQVLVELARMQIDRPDSARGAFADMPGGRSLFHGRRGAQKWLRLIEETKAYAEMTSGSDFTVQDLPKIRQPILAVFGEQSLRQRSARALQRLCPDCTLRIVPNAGHFFPLSRPRIFAAIAMEFRGGAPLPANLLPGGAGLGGAGLGGALGGALGGGGFGAGRRAERRGRLRDVIDMGGVGAITGPVPGSETLS